MQSSRQAELVLQSWVHLSGILKNNRITKGLQYNEAIVMMLLYNKYKEDGIGLLSIKEITQSTRMLKSLVNRTINSLEEKQLLERCESEGDRRMSYVRCVENKLEIFLQVHNQSLKLAENIISIVGKEDADAFIRIVKKLEEANYSLK